MNLVATSNFRNNVQDTLMVEDALHETFVHKGARLSLGGNLPFEKLSAADKRIIAELNRAGRIVDVSQTEQVKAIDAEVAAERKSTRTEAVIPVRK